MPNPQDTAIAHVAMLAAGGPADPSWRVTLHFHPDRLPNKSLLAAGQTASSV
ncbi:MAG: hypothetical protein ACRDNS_15685 [Trebonia sp.]